MKKHNNDAQRHKYNKLFDEIHIKCLKTTGQNDNPARHRRYVKLFDSVIKTSKLDGYIAECGCYRGCSLNLICRTLVVFNGKYDGSNLIAVDSFQGLSAATDKDQIDPKFYEQQRKAMSIPIEIVQHHLVEFPKITYYDGWIPEVFIKIPEHTYRFVHVDVDMYEPTLASLEYFWPRLIKDAIMICDDYSSKKFKGAKKAVDEFCAKNNATPILGNWESALIRK
jgi:hypothetical protein